MLWRKQEKTISDWIMNSGKSLMITGARQIGKTYIIRKVLNDSKCDYVEFNLIEQREIISLLKAVEMFDIQKFISRLSLLTKHEMIPGKTIIFFDEIQEYKEIVTLIKFLVEEGSFKYILSGSLLGVELRNLRSAPVGYLQIINMYPMDFEEFLIANGLRKEIIDELRMCFARKTPVDEIVHQRILETFYNYLVIGGMPEAVNIFLETQNYNRVMEIHQNIIALYKQDFSKYEIENKKLQLVRTYELIPSEINSKNKRFMISDLNKNLRYEKFEDSFTWLIKAGVALPIYNSTELEIPLEINKKSNLFKLFLSDVGLLSTLFGRETIIKILSEEKEINFGSIFENVIAQELIAHGYKGFYYQNKKYGELDFVIEYQGQVVPIEIKSGKDYTRHSALDNTMKRNPHIQQAFVFMNDNVRIINQITYYPIYMIIFLQNNEPITIKKKIDLSDL